MNTLIIPCAGKSTRFPNMKPKWLLTHPDGSLMIEKALSGLDLAAFDQIIITIIKEIDEKYDANLILNQLFNNGKFKICILDKYTQNVCETIYQTILKMSISGSIVIKDSDNYVKTSLPSHKHNYVVGYNLHKNPDVSNIPGKSFLVVNNQNCIQDIFEKEIVSHIIGLGVYGFSECNDFVSAYSRLIKNKNSIELYISHAISYLIANKNTMFEYVEASKYEDWGTFSEWKKVQDMHRSYFVDFDGIIMSNSGKYGKVNWSNNKNAIIKNVDYIKTLQSKGAQIIITSSRPNKFKTQLKQFLQKYDIKPHAIIMGLNHSCRVIINDFAPTNQYPSCIAISIPRNSTIHDYI